MSLFHKCYCHPKTFLALPQQQPLMFLLPISFDLRCTDGVEENHKLESSLVLMCVIFFPGKKTESNHLSLSAPLTTTPHASPTSQLFSGGGGRALLFTDLALTNHWTARAAPQNAIKWVGRDIDGSSARAFWALWCRRRTALLWENCFLSVRAPAIRSWKRAVTRRTDWNWTSRRCFMTAPSTASL